MSRSETHNGFDQFIPDWFHMHGIKVRVDNLEGEYFGPKTTDKDLVLSSNAVTVRIIRNKEPTEPRWIVKYEIIYSKTSRHRAEVKMTTATLRRAFDLDQKTPPSPTRNITHAHVEPDVFVRCGDCLNIPNRGTGHDHNHNVSIELDDHMRRLLLRRIDFKDVT